MNTENFRQLVWACRAGDLEKVKKLEAEGTNLDYNSENALCAASEYGHMEVVKYLVEKGANLNILDTEPLRLAVFTGHLHVARYLIEKGADIQCALKVAKRENDWNVVHFLQNQLTLRKLKEI